jgi:hypothetical protein
MISLDQLDSRVVDLGLLIGLLKDSGNREFSVNIDWFSDPVTQLEECPTRLSGLLSVIDNSFNVVNGIHYTTLDQSEVWYSIFSGVESSPTGLCLVAPKVGSASGVLSLGVFDQLSVEDLTISLYARVPLFYLEDGQAPQFILGSGSSPEQECKIAIEIYSSSAAPNLASALNFMSAVANVDPAKDLETDFTLSFFTGFDPNSGSKTEVTPAPADAIAALVSLGSYWLSSYIGDSTLTIGDLLTAGGLVNRTIDSITGKKIYSFDQARFNAIKASNPASVIKNLLIAVVRDLLDPLLSGAKPLVAI